LFIDKEIGKSMMYSPLLCLLPALLRVNAPIRSLCSMTQESGVIVLVAYAGWDSYLNSINRTRRT
jgi:hypothetical protein